MSELIVSVVVPVYGGEATIEPLCEQVSAALGDTSHEILLVCDRPRDGSWPVARRLAETRPEVKALRLRANVGQHAALLLGIRTARGRIVVTMDEDLQHPPEDVPALVREVRDRDCIVYGITKEQPHGLFRGFSSWFSKWALRVVFGVANAESMSAFRAFPIRARDAFVAYNHPHVNIDVLLSWTGLGSFAVRTTHQPRAAGESGYTTLKLVKHLWNMVLGFSVAPLRLAVTLGLVAMVIAFGTAAYAVINWLVFGSAVPGFAFLAATTSFMGGAQLLAIGVVGEYLGRMYVNSLHMPQYHLEEVVGADPS